MTQSDWYKPGDPREMTPPPEIDTSVAHPARIYDYWLGGKDNFAADREAGELVLASRPGLRESVRANRAFLRRVVTLLAGELRIRQFLDIGTGIPSADNTRARRSRGSSKGSNCSSPASSSGICGGPIPGTTPPRISSPATQAWHANRKALQRATGCQVPGARPMIQPNSETIRMPRPSVHNGRIASRTASANRS